MDETALRQVMVVVVVVVVAMVIVVVVMVMVIVVVVIGWWWWLCHSHPPTLPIQALDDLGFTEAEVGDLPKKQLKGLLLQRSQPRNACIYP